MMFIIKEAAITIMLAIKFRTVNIKLCADLSRKRKSIAIYYFLVFVYVIWINDCKLTNIWSIIQFKLLLNNTLGLSRRPAQVPATDSPNEHSFLARTKWQHIATCTLHTRFCTIKHQSKIVYNFKLYIVPHHLLYILHPPRYITRYTLFSSMVPLRQISRLGTPLTSWDTLVVVWGLPGS